MVIGHPRNASTAHIALIPALTAGMIAHKAVNTVTTPAKAQTIKSILATTVPFWLAHCVNSFKYGSTFCIHIVSISSKPPLTTSPFAKPPIAASTCPILSCKVDITQENVRLAFFIPLKNLQPSAVAPFIASSTILKDIFHFSISSRKSDIERPVFSLIACNGLNPTFTSCKRSPPVSFPALDICPNTRERDFSFPAFHIAISPSIDILPSTFS
jgi:hypothetical protein